ncbi:hypothetical protein E1301_Tti004364 [Triplophysa tibetana]|uniref:Uncharacterized protein n=1 Tax=Triplophysa tibetana TaxID=1572043 RepID=A0A5A9N6H4_9TELE|nr:hypothetical protein E1301_Tti004364 [Triplophysa tibetana]
MKAVMLWVVPLTYIIVPLFVKALRQEKDTEEENHLMEEKKKKKQEEKKKKEAAQKKAAEQKTKACVSEEKGEGQLEDESLSEKAVLGSDVE